MKKKQKMEGDVYENFPVVLKCLHNSQNTTAKFLREVSYLYNN
jgi:hypothetical protein